MSRSAGARATVLITAVAALTLVAPSTTEAADRALVIGIERYSDSRVPSPPGCVRDARALAELAVTLYDFPPSGVKVLLDEQATAAGIVREFREWLVAGTRPGDRVFFAYAGHGSQLEDQDGDELDGFDETLAPYDVNPITGANQIRDDEVEHLLAGLSARRALCLFDSCHSGTISRGLPRLPQFPQGGGVRYLPRPDQFRSLQANASSAPQRSWVVKGAASRDLLSDVPFVGAARLSGVVVISAAKSGQRAYPIEADGGFRGALSYVFGEIQRQSRLSLAGLQTRIGERIRELQRAGRLDGDQEPQVELVSSVPLANEPPFGSWEHGVAVALSNPLSRIRLALRARDGRVVFYAGETVSYTVETDTPGFLYLITFSPGELATVVFPNPEDRDNRVPAGVTAVPRGLYTIEVAAPFGRDLLVAVLSPRQLQLGEKERYSWAEVFQRLNVEALRRAVIAQSAGGRNLRRGTRQLRHEEGSGSPAAPTADALGPEQTWQAAALAIETRP